MFVNVTVQKVSSVATATKDQHDSSNCTSSLWQQLQKVNTMATTQVVAVATTAQGQYQGNSCWLTQWQQLQKVNAVEKEGKKKTAEGQCKFSATAYATLRMCANTTAATTEGAGYSCSNNSQLYSSLK